MNETCYVREFKNTKKKKLSKVINENIKNTK